MDGISHYNKKIITSKIEELSEIYSSTIVNGILDAFPNLNDTMVDIIKELSKSSYIDGSVITLNMLIKSE